MPDADRPADANEPTEPGLYYWTWGPGHRKADDWDGWPGVDGTAEPMPVAVDWAGDVLEASMLEYEPYEGGSNFGYPVADIGGTWGSRIPPSPRLAAMEELAAREPWRRRGGSNDWGCHHCDASLGGTIDAARAWLHRHERHADTCAWLRAQREKPKEDN